MRYFCVEPVVRSFTILSFTLAFGLASLVVAEAAAPPAVTVTAVTQQNVAPSFTNIGHVVAIQTVKIVPRVTAFIDQVNVRQGSDVIAGEVLFTLQKTQYQAALQTALITAAWPPPRPP
jgi:multidrug efflux pump subunit AcrA (membrane-fusion protein)